MLTWSEGPPHPAVRAQNAPYHRDAAVLQTADIPCDSISRGDAPGWNAAAPLGLVWTHHPKPSMRRSFRPRGPYCVRNSGAMTRAELRRSFGAEYAHFVLRLHRVTSQVPLRGLPVRIRAPSAFSAAICFSTARRLSPSSSARGLTVPVGFCLK